jgi:hypothetical protein
LYGPDGIRKKWTQPVFSYDPDGTRVEESLYVDVGLGRLPLSFYYDYYETCDEQIFNNAVDAWAGSTNPEGITLPDDDDDLKRDNGDNPSKPVITPPPGEKWWEKPFEE